MRIYRAAIGLCVLGGTAAGQDLVYAVTGDQTLITFNAGTPGTVLSGVPLMGLAPNERIRGIDFRPATGELFALGSFSNLYTINTASGAVSPVGAGPFAPALNGSSFGFDFNPTIDRIRVVSEADQNLVLNPNTGTATGVTPLFYPTGDPNAGANPNVVASAYTNSFAGATTTQLFGIDTGLDILVTQANSAGTLGTVGSLGVDLNDSASFDISGGTGRAYASVQGLTVGQSTFWRINLATGAATQIGSIGGGAIVTAIAVVPAPMTASVLAAGAVFTLRRRR
jgi:hypothetical protein